MGYNGVGEFFLINMGVVSFLPSRDIEWSKKPRIIAERAAACQPGTSAGEVHLLIAVPLKCDPTLHIVRDGVKYNVCPRTTSLRFRIRL